MRFLVVACLLVSLLGAGGASARSSNHPWLPFHIHANAYGSWGACTADWHHNAGTCTGQMEAGSFLGHHYPAHFKVQWTWEGTSLDISLHDPTWHPLSYMKGTKPSNWFTYTVTNAYLIPSTTEAKHYRSGKDGAAGEVDGPLFVHLSSHSDHYHKGYSLDLRGYLQRYK
jgi:hypothetical protein